MSLPSSPVVLSMLLFLLCLAVTGGGGGTHSGGPETDTAGDATVKVPCRALDRSPRLSSVTLEGFSFHFTVE